MKKSDLALELEISRSVIGGLSDDELRDAKKFLDNLAEYKYYNKLYTTYIEGVEESLTNTGNGKIYCEYNIDGAVTGRMSNSGSSYKEGQKKKKLGISFHTLPREKEDLEINIRNYIIAPPGWDFITADVKSAELRVLAHVANETKMIDAFNNNIDLHRYTASMVFNKKMENVTKEERQIAKEVSFLTIYGGTAYTLARKRNISESRAEMVINSWMAAFPRIPIYMQTVEEYIKQHKYIKTIFGRRRSLPNIDSPVKSIAREAFRQGLNFTVQSPASDIVGFCVVGTYLRMKEEKLKGKLIGEVHDSLEGVSPKNETKRLIEIMRDEMTNCRYMQESMGMCLKVPMEVEIEVGTSFGNGVKV